MFLNSNRVVTDLMDKRAGIYSSRADYPMAFDTMSDGNSILLCPYGPKWRAARKLLHSVLSKASMHFFAPYQDLESKQFLLDFLHKPEDWYVAAKAYSNSVVMSITFGKRARGKDPHIYLLFDLTAEIAASLMPGAWLVDGFPILDRLLPTPLKWWRQSGLDVQNKARK